MKVRVLLDRIDRGNRRLQFAIIPEHASGETALPEGVRPFPKRASRTTDRREKIAAEAPARTRKPSPRSAKRSKAKAAPLSSSSPFAKFGADGSSVRKKKNKDRIAASKKKGKKR
jgi:ribonuclease R